MKIEERVINIVSEQLSVAKDKIILTSHFENDLGADSLDFVELIMALEEEFDVEISDEVADCIETVGDVIVVVDELM